MTWKFDGSAFVTKVDSRHPPPLLYFVALEGLLGAVKEMLAIDPTGVNILGGLHGNALGAASFRGHQDVVQLLLGHGAFANAQGGEYGTALVAAASAGHEYVVKALLEAGADESLAPDGDDVLVCAVCAGHENVVRILLDKGTKVTQRALESASEYHLPRVNDALLRKIPAEDAVEFCSNALLSASKQGEYDIARALIDKGACFTKEDRMHRTALLLAAENGHEKLFELLIQRGAYCDGVDYEIHPLYAASTHGMPVKTMQSFPLEQIDEEVVRRSLVSASQIGHYDSVKMILERCIIPHQVDLRAKFLFVPFTIAVLTQNGNIASMLLD
ncbi:ankyrin repeat-containing domain protein [Colletotrichum lupini]|nr:ankyrin repeat-containing domain protein [Colletotrichum lupini]